MLCPTRPDFTKIFMGYCARNRLWKINISAFTKAKPALADGKNPKKGRRL